MFLYSSDISVFVWFCVSLRAVNKYTTFQYCRLLAVDSHTACEDVVSDFERLAIVYQE